MIQAEMASLRARIDEIDGRLVRLLKERFELTERVGVLKAAIGEPARQPARQAQRARLLVELAEVHGLAPDVLSAVFRVISAEVVERHRRIAACSSAGPNPTRC